MNQMNRTSPVIRKFMKVRHASLFGLSLTHDPRRVSGNQDVSRLACGVGYHVYVYGHPPPPHDTRKPFVDSKFL